MRLAITKLIFVLAMLAAASPLFAQDDGPDTRSIKSSDFKKSRPEPVQSAPRANPAKPSTVIYKYVRTERRSAKPKATVGTAKPMKGRAQPSKSVTSKAVPLTETLIGLTMWKLRPPKAGESGFYIPVELDDKKIEQWLAERVGVTNRFSIEDRVRLAIESSVKGYLYIVNRETYSDDTVGDPFLIFPTVADGDNSVSPGLLFDIPDQRMEFPYFSVRPRQSSTKKALYDGDLLTFIISPRQLTGFGADPEDDRLLNAAALNKLEETAESYLFERSDLEDKIFTKIEADSTCGSETRGLERKKPTGNPCGRAKSLDREAVGPQTLFKVRAAEGEPVVAFVRLAVQK